MKNRKFAAGEMGEIEEITGVGKISTIIGWWSFLFAIIATIILLAIISFLYKFFGWGSLTEKDVFGISIPLFAFSFFFFLWLFVTGVRFIRALANNLRQKS